MGAQTWRICTILRSVRLVVCHTDNYLIPSTAHKEDDPEKALKEFQAIIDKEQEKGDW